MNPVLLRVMAIAKYLCAFLYCLRSCRCEFCWNLRMPPGSVFHTSVLPHACGWGGGAGTRIFPEAIRDLLMENLELDAAGHCVGRLSPGSRRSRRPGRSSRFRSHLCVSQGLLISVRFSVLEGEGRPLVHLDPGVCGGCKAPAECPDSTGSVSSDGACFRVRFSEPRSQTTTNDLYHHDPVPMIKFLPL